MEEDDEDEEEEVERGIHLPIVQLGYDRPASVIVAADHRWSEQKDNTDKQPGCMHHREYDTAVHAEHVCKSALNMIAHL